MNRLRRAELMALMSRLYTLSTRVPARNGLGQRKGKYEAYNDAVCDGKPSGMTITLWGFI